MKDSGYLYLCSAGESFDSVALELFGDEKYAAELLSMNPGLCEKMVFTGGEQLTIPEIETAVDDTGRKVGNAPWKE